MAAHSPFKPPLCKGRWHFRKKMTEGLAVRKTEQRTILNTSRQPLSRSAPAPLTQGSLWVSANKSCSRKIVRTRIRTPHPSAFGCHLPPLGKAFGKCEHRLKPKDNADNVTAGASPRPTNVTLISVLFRGNLFSVSRPNLPLSAPPWQSFFIPAQGSPNTIKTVGGEMICTPKVRHFWRCIFLCQKSRKSTRQN